VYAVAPSDESVEKLESLGCRCYDVYLDNSGMNVLNDYKYLRNYKKLLSTIQPDVVLSYTIKPNIYGTIAAGRLKIPVINNVSGLGTAFLWNKLLKTLVIGLYKYAFQKSSHIFFQNEHDRSLFLNEVKISAKNTSVLPGSGVDTRHFAPEAEHHDNKEFTFLMISRLLVDKGIEEYCEAARRIRAAGAPAKFQILGKPEESHQRGYSKAKITSLEKEGVIEYLGTTTDVRPYIAAADCVVLPSYREGTAKTLLEAASMGKPMIATDVPGCNNVVEHKVNGLLCKVKSTDGLCEAFMTMLKSEKETLHGYAKESRAKAINEFDEQIVIARYIDQIEAVTGQHIRKLKSKEEVLV
ncbi:MAG: glycosyltransferase family 4 protein, partial [Bacteroidota bacterium]